VTDASPPQQPEAVMEIGCPHGAWGMVVSCPHCGTPRHVSPSQLVSDRFLSEVERGEREYPSGAVEQPLPQQPEALPPCPICGKDDLFIGTDGRPGCPHCEVAVLCASTRRPGLGAGTRSCYSKGAIGWPSR
jgi:hypothetical protein